MSRWDSSTGTLLFFPDAAASALTDGERRRLERTGLRLPEDPHANNPLAWMDARGVGMTVRLYDRWGGLDWDNADQVKALWEVAEAATLRSRNRWYAVCNYHGWEDDVRTVCEHPDFDDVRQELARLNDKRRARKQSLRHISPDEAVVHKVQGPVWTPDAK